MQGPQPSAPRSRPIREALPSHACGGLLVEAGDSVRTLFGLRGVAPPQAETPQPRAERRVAPVSSPRDGALLHRTRKPYEKA